MAQPQITSADRVRDLSSINASVPSLLSNAGAALQALTGKPMPARRQDTSNGDIDISPSDTTGASQPSLEASKEAFTTNAQAYFNTLQAIMARLRRQAYALEEAGIIAAEAPSLASSASEQQQQQSPPASRASQARGVGAATAAQRQQDDSDRLTNGGLGGLDVAYLNSRVGREGIDKEAELLEEAKALVQDAIVRAKEAHGDTQMDDAP